MIDLMNILQKALLLSHLCSNTVVFVSYPQDLALDTSYLITGDISGFSPNKYHGVYIDEDGLIIFNIKSKGKKSIGVHINISGYPQPFNFMVPSVLLFRIPEAYVTFIRVLCYTNSVENFSKGDYSCRRICLYVQNDVIAISNLTFD